MPEPTVSIVAVVRGEPDRRLDAMVRSCAAQRWTGPIELLVAASPEEVAGVEKHLTGWNHGEARVVPNPGGRRSVGLNRAIDEATGDVVVRVDARSTLPPEHVQLVVERLASEPHIGVVGGVQWPTARVGAGTVAEGIALALRNPWLMGGAAYRRPGASGEVDTVYLGAFRRDEVAALRFDETLDANEDFELCQRYRQRGQVVWLEEALVVPYEPRESLVDLSAQYQAFGRAKVDMWRRTGSRANARQRLALVGAAVALLGLAASIRAPRRLITASVAVGCAIAASDTRSDVRASPAARLVAVIAQCVLQVSWSYGCARQLAVGSQPRGRRL